MRISASSKAAEVATDDAKVPMHGQMFTLPREGRETSKFVGNFHVCVDHTQGKVTVDFGQNLSYLEMDPDKADALCAIIQKHAMAARIGI